MIAPLLYKIGEGETNKLKRPIYVLKQSRRNWNTERKLFSFPKTISLRKTDLKEYNHPVVFIVKVVGS